MDDDDGGIGEIIETQRSNGTLTFEWQIPNFFRPVKDCDRVLYDVFGSPIFQPDEAPGDYSSPPFSFCNECWTLNFDPEMDWDQKTGASIGLCFYRHKDCSRRTVHYTFAIKALNGIEQSVKDEQEFDAEGEEELGWPDIMLQSDLRRHKSRLVPGNVLTIVGTFKSDEPRISLLSRNLNCQKSLLAEGSPSDFTLKVGNREWPVHKRILANTSEYFSSMFGREWSENTAGEVRLDDVTEDALDSVLKFIYCGEVKDVPVEHVCGIYIAAHKFLLEDLQTLCVETMKKNMGPDTVWESLTIAKIYEKKDLEKCALEYLNEDDDIKNLCLKDWKQFEQNYPSIAAEVRKEIIDDWDDESDESDMDELENEYEQNHPFASQLLKEISDESYESDF